MNWLEMRKRATSLLATAREKQKTLQAGELESAEIDALATEIEQLVDEANKLNASADRLEALETSIGDAESSTAIAATPRSEPDDPEATDPDTARRVLPATVRNREEEDRAGFADLGEFALSVFQASPGAGAAHRVDPRLGGLYNESAGRPGAAATGLSQGVGAEGGWLIPPAFSSAIWDGMRMLPDALLPMTDEFPISAESITLLANAETSRTTGNRYGGVRGYWLEEAEQLTASKPKVRKVKLEPHGLGALVYVTDKLLNNGGAAVTAWLQRACTDELNWLIGNAIIDGNGQGQPLGILRSGGRVTVAKETNQAADSLTQRNVEDMWARMHARARANAVWLINQDVDPELGTMVTVVKNVAGTENVGGFSAGAYNADRDTLKGRPIMRTEWNKTLGDEGDVILADLRSYATAFQRAGISSAMSMHLRFDYNETAFRFITDVDGQPYNAAPLTPANGTNTLSPFVTLADRA